MKRLNVNEAVTALQHGELVVLPTETLYGLAADGLNDQAIEKLYEVKRRPKNNPIMLQIGDLAMLKDVVVDVPDSAKKLMEAFWPGPLTLVLAKLPTISTILSAGTDTIGVRMPDQALTLEILKKVNRPLAVPSANISNQNPPKTPEDVEAQLEDKNIAGIVDAGECKLGIASTVVDLTGAGWRILRGGSITEEEIARVLGDS